MFKYTAIGSRDTPIEMKRLMSSISGGLENIGGIMRSGGAIGADSFFEIGVKNKNNKEIYLPYLGFNKKQGIIVLPNQQALNLIESIHPYWSKIKPGTFSYNAHIRNMYQVLGRELNEPSEFVVCWTPDGAQNEQESSVDKTGGTRSAIVLAHRSNIPIFNLYHPNAVERLKHFVQEKELKNKCYNNLNTQESSYDN